MRSRAEDPDAWARAAAMPTSWVPFMLEDPVAAACLATVGTRYPDHQLALLDGDEAVGKVRSVPLPWQVGRRELPAHGWDAVLLEAADAEERPATGVATLLEATVRPDLQGRGLSRELLVRARERLRALGVVELFAPVRPSAKCDEPDTPMREYVARVRADGLPADPWLRTHVRLGATVVQVCPVSMTISGTLDEWAAWTGSRFTASGPATVPGALTRVHVDLEADHAVYVEPNVWVRHDLTGG
jgi:GNAT superfamily N-acetyltransferase